MFKIQRNYFENRIIGLTVFERFHHKDETYA